MCFAVGQSKGPFLGACARNIRLWAATHDIDLNYVHAMDKYDRAADLLSRWSNSVNDQNEVNMLIPSVC